MTVEAALQLASLQAGMPEVMAGETQLHRPIRWVHVAEVDNIASLLRGSELLLTTGTGLGAGDRALERFVAELSERGIAGLVLELGARFKVAPPAMVAAAAEHDLPLIVLHREVAFVEVTEAINEELNQRELAKARRADRLHQELTALLLDGGGIPEVLSALAAAIANPVVLERGDGELLFHAVHTRESTAVLSAWDAIRNELPGAPDHIAIPIPSGRAGMQGTVLAIAVDGALGGFAQAALERAAGLIGLVARQNRHEQALAARARGHMLVGLIDAGLAEADIWRQVAAMGFPKRVPHLLPCVFAAARGYHTLHVDDETVWTGLWAELRRELEGQAIPVIGGLTPRGREIALVVGLASASQRASRADTVARLFATALARATGSAAMGNLYVGVSGRSWTSALTGLREVIEAAAWPRPGDELWHDATRPDLDRLLWTLRDSTALRSFVERRIGPLVEHDAQRSTKLIPTLEAYLKCDGHKAATARMLHLERQSVYHRIGRIEALLGDSLDDDVARLGVHLAMRARHLLRAHGEPNAAGPD